jgi:hypothetical protein
VNAALSGELFKSTMTVPKFQHGGFLPPRGLGIVGEEGPELITGGRTGKTITPLTGGFGTFVYAPQLSTASPAEAEEFARKIGPAIERWRRRGGF